MRHCKLYHGVNKDICRIIYVIYEYNVDKMTRHMHSWITSVSSVPKNILVNCTNDDVEYKYIFSDLEIVGPIGTLIRICTPTLSFNDAKGNTSTTNSINIHDIATTQYLGMVRWYNGSKNNWNIIFTS
jgi:hypothetical protein